VSAYPVLALEVALLLVAFPLLWKSASLRGDQYNKWDARVEIAYAGLSERALQCLREIRSHSDALVDDPKAPFEPDLALADPAPLRRITQDFTKLLTARQRLRSRFHQMLLICRVCPFVLGIFVVSMIVIVLASFAVLTPIWADQIALGVAASAALIGVIILALYTYLNWHLSSAESMGRPLREPWHTG
jgi:hypothetical protein